MEIYFERASWMWSLSLIVVTISIQAIGVVMMALGMVENPVPTGGPAPCDYGMWSRR